jgi:hypothetical protein
MAAAAAAAAADVDVDAPVGVELVATGGCLSQQPTQTTYPVVTHGSRHR